MDEEITKDSLYKWLMAVVFLGVMAIMTIYIAGLKSRLDTLERQTAEQQTIQETRMDDLSVYIDTVREEMTFSFEEQQKQIDEQSERLTSVKSIVHNTNAALGRANKSIEEKESEIQELREELKKH